ncbi:unnamed protein product [Rotaria socialis]|uniref:F-box domain-containing protein n=1 Tax=Rotaria socialis TaxID=392032 RepID=A0A818JIB7_9BILA|nr:unnamed protein product [Rotaria socialis]
MNISTTQRPSLCTLPVELIHHIFHYLDAQTIVRSFRSVCKQFYTIVKAYDQFKLDFNASLKSDFLFLCNFISPENIQSLTLSDRDETPGQVEFFLSFTRIKQFTRLRYLTIFEIDDCYLNIILKDLSTLTLQSLCIHSERDYSRDNTSLDQLSSVMSLPSLHNVNLNIPNLNLSELLWSLECKVQHLEIYCRTLDEYCNILNHLPNLRKFVVIQLNQDSTDEIVTQLSNLTPFRQLSYLAFKHCHIDIILLELLLLLAPSIERLQLIRSIDLHTFIAHLHQWANFVETKLPFLTQFEFFLTEDEHDFNFTVDTESLIDPFRTSFWTEKKSWFAICDYIVYPRTVILYTPLTFDPEFEYVYESKEIRRSSSVPNINNATKMDGVRKLRLDLTNVMTLATSSQGGLPHNIRFPRLDQLTIRIGDEWPLGSLRFLSSLVDLSNLIKLSLQISSAFYNSSEWTDVHGAKQSLEKSLNEINVEIYPKSIIQYIDQLMGKLKRLNEYSIKPNSMLVLGLKSILAKSLHRLLKENYYIDELVYYTDQLDEHFYLLTVTTINTSVSINLFDEFTISYRNMTNRLTDLHKKLCFYMDKSQSNFNKQILIKLNMLHESLQFFIQFIEKHILNKINIILDTEQENKIHKSIVLIECLIISIIVCITIVPLIFIGIKFLLEWKVKHIQQTIDQVGCLNIQRSNQEQYPLDVINNDALPNQLKPYGVYNDMNNTSGENSNSSSNNNLMEKNKTDDHHSVGIFLFSIRLCFALINMLIIILSLITGFLYGLDLLLNMSCELVHHNQTLLISLVTNNFVNQSGTFDVNRTIFNIINDCNRNVHFSKILFENASTQLQNELSSTIKDINQNIFDQFLNFNNKINITSDLHLLMSIASSSGLTKIVMLLKSIDHDFEQIRQIFQRILKRNSTLLTNFTSSVFNEFEEFTMKVIQSTIEKCPLPKDTILRADELICHQTAKNINGLWLQIFLFSFSMITGIYILGIYIYKQLF